MKLIVYKSSFKDGKRTNSSNKYLTYNSERKDREKVEYSKLWYSCTPSHCPLSFVLKSESRISFFLRYIILRMHFLTLIYNSALIPITNRIPVNLHLLKVRGKLGKKLSSHKSGGRRTRKRRSRTTIKRHFSIFSPSYWQHLIYI